MKINLSLGKEWGELKKFEKLSDDERSIVFYAENRASMNHFRLLINHLTEIMNLKICYVTSVKDDPIFSTINKNIFAYIDPENFLIDPNILIKNYFSIFIYFQYFWFKNFI